ncbi:MAG TPA: amidohydrolase family protein [Vicinamibacterales bacterium]|nr:amidohydrolase family protein [Vicinamibacterales bacterium]
MTLRTAATLVVAAGAALTAPAASGQRQPEPIIDMHMHALAADEQGPPPMAMCAPFPDFFPWDPKGPYLDQFIARFKKPACKDPIWSPMTDAEVLAQTLAIADRRNITGVLSGPAANVDAWIAARSERFIPALSFQLGTPGTPTVAALRRRHAEGKLKVLGEVTNQYAGILPDDPRMAPYWRLAEELDIPVGIHVGTGPPGVIYLDAPKYRARLHSALTLEEVLVKHPKLRVYVMHAGYPMLDDMLAVLYAHPQVYVDVGIIVYNQPRPAFYRYLQTLVESGFGRRVMFGSDQMVWPATIERAIATIEDAPFLSAAQKRDIFYNNAARFLRLPAAAR